MTDSLSLDADPKPRASRSGLADFVLPIAAGVLSLVYGLVTPAFEAPDEIVNFEYALHVARSGTLPVQSAERPNAGHQPPLYYVAAAALIAPVVPRDYLRPPFNQRSTLVGGTEVPIIVHGSAETFPFDGTWLALHFGRVASALFAAGAVTVTIALAREAFPGQVGLVGLAGALVAFQPQLLFLGGAISSDPAIAFLGGGAALAAFRAVHRAHERHWLICGAWLSAALLTKSTAIGPVIASGMLVALESLRGRSTRLLVRRVLVLGAPVCVAVAALVARNLALYGEPTGYSIYRRAWAPSLRGAPFTLSDLGEMAGSQLRSFWGTFGWSNLFYPTWLDRAFALLTLLALTGALLTAWRHPNDRRALVSLAIFALAAEAYMLIVVLDCNSSCYQGRYVFAALAPIGVLLGRGLLELVPRSGERRAALALAVTLGLVAGVTPFAVIGPAYPMVAIPKWRTALIQHPTSFVVGGAFEMIGYDLKRAGLGAEVTLYWRARALPIFDYSAFVHAVGPDGQILAQDDRAPGEVLGHPPTRWQVGDVVADRHLLPRADARLRFGLYDWRTGDQLPIEENGVPLGGFAWLPD